MSEPAAMVLTRSVPVLPVAASALRRWGHRNASRVADGGVDDPLQRPIGLDLLGAA